MAVVQLVLLFCDSVSLLYGCFAAVLLCCGETSSEGRREPSLFIPCTVLYCSSRVQRVPLRL